MKEWPTESKQLESNAVEEKSIEQAVEAEIETLFQGEDIEMQLQKSQESIDEAVDRVLLQLKIKNGIHEDVSQEAKTKFADKYPLEKVKSILMEYIKDQQM